MKNYIESFNGVGDYVLNKKTQRDNSQAFQKAANMNGVSLGRGKFYCNSKLTIPGGDGFYLMGDVGYQSTLILGPDAYIVYDGINSSEALRFLIIQNIRIHAEEREPNSPIFRLISGGSNLGKKLPGSDAYRFITQNLHILGTGKTGIGVDLQGNFIATHHNLIVQQTNQSLNIDQSAVTSYGANAMHFIGGEIQGNLQGPKLRDTSGINMDMTIEGNDSGIELVAPNDGVRISRYFEKNKNYDIKCSDDPNDSAAKNRNITVDESTVFKEGNSGKVHSIILENAENFRRGGIFVKHTGDQMKQPYLVSEGVTFAGEKHTYYPEKGNQGGAFTLLHEAIHKPALDSFDEPIEIEYLLELSNSFETKEIQLKISGNNIAAWSLLDKSKLIKVNFKIYGKSATEQLIVAELKNTLSDQVKSVTKTINTATTDLKPQIYARSDSDDNVVLKVATKI